MLALAMMLTSVSMSGLWAVAGETVPDASEETVAYLVADDEYTGIIRTPFRYYPDSVLVLSGSDS